jgi:hypothetical protein
MNNTINTIVEFESSLDNVFCALREHLREHMQAIEYRHLNDHFCAITDIIADTLQEMRNMQAAEKARDRREKLDALQAMFIDIGESIGLRDLSNEFVDKINTRWADSMGAMKEAIWEVERRGA